MGVSVHALVAILLCILTILGENLFWFFSVWFCRWPPLQGWDRLLFIFKKRKASVEHRRPLFAQPRQSSSCDSASVLKLLSSKTEDLFLLNLLWICSSRCLLREIKYFGCSGGWEHLSVESKRHERLKSETKKGEILGCGSSKQINSLPVWAWGEAGDEPQPSLPHLNLPTSTKDVWTLLSASFFFYPSVDQSWILILEASLGNMSIWCVLSAAMLFAWFKKKKRMGKKGHLGWEFRLCFCSFLKVRLMSRCRVSVNVEHHQQVFCRVQVPQQETRLISSLIIASLIFWHSCQQVQMKNLRTAIKTSTESVCKDSLAGR